MTTTVPGVTSVQNTNPGLNPTSVSVALNSASYAPGTLTGIAIQSNSTRNEYSFGLLNTLNTATVATIGSGYISGRYVTIGTPASGRTLATGLLGAVTGAGGINTATITIVNGGSGYDPSNLLNQPIVQ